MPSKCGKTSQTQAPRRDGRRLGVEVPQSFTTAQLGSEPFEQHPGGLGVGKHELGTPRKVVCVKFSNLPWCFDSRIAT
ncbi:MAG: hypothetical protein ACE15E_19685, partial [Acidobacteriota bacterium]